MVAPLDHLVRLLVGLARFLVVEVVAVDARVLRLQAADLILRALLLYVEHLLRIFTMFLENVAIGLFQKHLLALPHEDAVFQAVDLVFLSISKVVVEQPVLIQRLLHHDHQQLLVHANHPGAGVSRQVFVTVGGQVQLIWNLGLNSVAGYTVLVESGQVLCLFRVLESLLAFQVDLPENLDRNHVRASLFDQSRVLLDRRVLTVLLQGIGLAHVMQWHLEPEVEFRHLHGAVHLKVLSQSLECPRINRVDVFVLHVTVQAIDAILTGDQLSLVFKNSKVSLQINISSIF